MAKKDLYVGVDLGGTKVLASVIDEAGGVLTRAKKKTKASEGVDPVVGRMCECVTRAVAAAGIEMSAVAGLGVGVCGPVDFAKGVVITAGNMPWKNVPLAEMLRKKLGIRSVVIDNDVNAGAHGEWKCGAGRGCDSQISIFVGTGIGGGLILDGRLYRGHFHTAGEIGHTIIDTGGGMTSRSLEDLASRGAIGVVIARRITTNHPSGISKMVDEKKLFTTIRSGVLAKGYFDKDAVTVRCIEESARYIGTAAANAVTMLSLKRVVIGGGLTEALGKPYVKLIEKQLRDDCWPETLDVAVVEAELGDDAVIVGAALLARDNPTEPKARN